MSIPATAALKSRVLSAGRWTLVGYAFSYVFRLGSSLLMTRLLLPEMFGIVAIAYLVQTGLAMFSDVGLKPNVVRSARGDDESFLDTAWLIQIVRGGLLAVGGGLVSIGLAILARGDYLPIGSVYADPNLPLVIAVVSLSPAIAGFESTKTLQASRNLLLGRLTALEIISQVSGFFVMLTFALANPSVGALVAGGLSSTIVRTILSHVWLPGTRNRLQWSRSAFSEIIRFGKWLFLATVLFFVAVNGDRLILAGLIDTTSLGTYAIAYLIFSAIDQLLDKVSVDLCFPALSEVVRERKNEVVRIYYKFHIPVSLFSYFCAGFLIVAGHSVISILYDRRYQQAGWILELLSVAILTFPFRVAAQTLLAFGLANTFFQLNLARVVVLLVALPIGFAYAGFEGGVWGVVLSYFASLPVLFYYAAPLGLFDLRKELGLVPAAIAGALVGGLSNQIIALLRM